MSKEEVNLNALVPKEMHKKLKMQLLKDEITFKDWLKARITEYVEEE